MAKKPKKENVEDKEQSRRFVETAKELGVDESGKSFNKAFKAVVPSTSSPKSQKKNKREP